MKIQTTPLKIWGWVSVIFIITQSVLVLFFFKAKVDLNNNEDYYNQINYMHQEFRKNNSYKVIIIGSSLIGHGVACSDEITTYLSSKKNVNINLLKIWDSNDPLNKFINLNLIEEIIKAKPDLVLFQTELAAINFTKNKQWIQKVSFINKSIIRYIFSLKQGNKYSSKNRFCPKNIDIQFEYDTIKHIPQKRKVKPINDLHFVFNGFKRLQKEGIKTVLIDIPRPVQSEKIIYTKPFNEQLHKLFNVYYNNFGITHWNYTGAPIYYKHCIDEGHLNKKGRNIYTEWLLAKIEKEI